MSIEAGVDDQGWKNLAKRIQRKLTASEIAKVMKTTSYWGLRRTVEVMPKRSGALKRSWKVAESRGGQDQQIYSDSKVALFLEDGTKTHGPKTKKLLYIPLRPGAAVWRKGFVWGKDYILVKKVKGIKALKYLKPLSSDVLSAMAQNFVSQLGEI